VWFKRIARRPVVTYVQPPFKTAKYPCEFCESIDIATRQTFSICSMPELPAEIKSSTGRCCTFETWDGAKISGLNA